MAIDIVWLDDIEDEVDEQFLVCVECVHNYWSVDSAGKFVRIVITSAC